MMPQMTMKMPMMTAMIPIRSKEYSETARMLTHKSIQSYAQKGGKYLAFTQRQSADVTVVDWMKATIRTEREVESIENDIDDRSRRRLLYERER